MTSLPIKYSRLAQGQSGSQSANAALSFVGLVLLACTQIIPGEAIGAESRAGGLSFLPTFEGG